MASDGVKGRRCRVGTDPFARSASPLPFRDHRSCQTKPTILVQLDTDPLPSVFDRVVAVDAGVQHVFSYGGVTPQNVMPLVHGCIFTRGPKDLHRTAIFIGGSDVAAGEAVLAEVREAPDPAVRPERVADARLQRRRTPPRPRPSGPRAGTST